MSIRSPSISILLAFTVLFALGCDEESTTSCEGNGEETSSNLALRIERTNKFAFDLYQELRSSEGNLLISPHSIAVAFGMTYAGARGKTESDMAEVLCFRYPQSGFHSALKELNELLMSRGKPELEDSFRLSMANGCWGREDLTYLPAYLDTLAINYGTSMQYLDIANEPEESRTIINQWVAEQTEDRILELMPSGKLDDQTYLVLANTVYFRAAWLHRFGEGYTNERAFTLIDGGQISVPIMRGELRFRYCQGVGYRAVELPYVGEEVAMLVILPDEGQFEAFESSMDAQKLAAVIVGLKETYIVLGLPRFSFTSDFVLIATLHDMGMTDAFSPGANFSGMDGIDDGVPWIDVVAHKTFISVDENGTEASAGTIMELSLGIHDYLWADRPFLFVIRDTETGTILFLGRVLDPRG